MRQWIVAAAGAALLWPASAGASTPEQMASQVAQSLRESGQLQNYRVGVKYEDGVAWLLGSVTSADQSATAERLAREVEGVSHVVNKLEIVEASAAEKVETKTNDALQLASLDQPELEAPAPLPPNPAAMPAAQAPSRQAPSRGMPLAMRQMGGGQPNMQQRPMQQGPMQQGPMQGGPVQPAQYGAAYAGGMPQGQSTAGAQGVSYDQANMPNYAWPSYAAHPNYAAVSYPQQYSASAWPYIGPFHPYPQVPLGWRKVTLEWDDGWWFLDFSHQECH
ncbi:periplasmic protein [Botrimarina colliarenosi]|uniref:Periplasmic protein n=1 Tax=Botrimarina colliarenosi TaxID=2528001 RepID=A0A5C6AM49_9BACT|nr:BON domain-containing protein [Botrimarina colliarenosi]TWU00196.1 periplasmic protein [Botrimarina colliarenosi]